MHMHMHTQRQRPCTVSRERQSVRREHGPEGTGRCAWRPTGHWAVTTTTQRARNATKTTSDDKTLAPEAKSESAPSSGAEWRHAHSPTVLCLASAAAIGIGSNRFLGRADIGFGFRTHSSPSSSQRFGQHSKQVVHHVLLSHSQDTTTQTPAPPRREGWRVAGGVE
eukprot:scaffold920_cov135-Isochrysis_galbana.AAC.9